MLLLRPENHFSKGALTPQCFPTVVREMSVAGCLVPVKSLEPPRGWASTIGSGIYVGLGAIVSMAIGGEAKAKDEDEDEAYVVCACVDAGAARLRGLGSVVSAREAEAAVRGRGGRAEVVMTLLEHRGEVVRFEAGGEELFVKVQWAPIRLGTRNAQTPRASGLPTYIPIRH